MTDAPDFRANRPIRTGLAGLLMLVLLVGLWGSLARIEGAVIVPGQVQVDGPRQIVQHPEGGVVAHVALRDGQIVRAGDALLTLDSGALRAERAILDARLTETRARRARLQAERDARPAPAFPPDLLARARTDPLIAEQIAGQSRLFDARHSARSHQLAQISRQITQVDARLDGLLAQSRAVTRQTRLVTTERALQARLQARGLAPSDRLNALDREAARLQGSLGDLAAQRAETLARREAIALQRLYLIARQREEAANDLRDTDLLATELAQRLAALDARITGLTLRAPVSGIVLGLTALTPHAVIRPAEPILQIIPQDRPLVVRLHIPPLQSGAVQPGQPVRITLPGPAVAALPDIHGTLRHISADTLTDPATGAAFYRAEVALDPARLPPDARHLLRPGQPAEAYLLTGSRSPLSWFLHPLVDMARRALREG